MIRWAILGLAVLLSSCASSRAHVILYDFEGTPVALDPAVKLDATIVVLPVSAPSWLRGTAVLYRLDYTAASHPLPYALSQWVAPPGELMTLRLRERISAANAGFTLTRATRGAREFRLEATLDHFIQVFASPTQSHCTVTLTVILARGATVLGQRSFTAEEAAPTADAAGAVRGLVQATDADIEQIVRWIDTTLRSRTAEVD